MYDMKLCNTCNKKVIKSHRLRGGYEFCSDECRNKAIPIPANNFLCRTCGGVFQRENFYFHNGKYRNPSCIKCCSIRRKEYHKNHSNEARLAHTRWRESCLSKGGKTAVRWYLNRKMSNYKNRAKYLKIKYNLSLDYLVDLYNKQNNCCYYTGKQMRLNTYGVGSNNIPHNAVSLDRLNPKLGYINGNVVFCQQSVNLAKRDMTKEQFIEMCEIISAKFKH